MSPSAVRPILSHRCVRLALYQDRRQARLISLGNGRLERDELMRILIGALFAILVTSLISCVHKYAVPTAPRSHGVLPAASTVYVATPSDGRDDRPRTYEGSGSWTRSAIADALRERGMRIVPEGDVVEVPEAVIAAGKAGADFLVYTRIVHWSDRATLAPDQHGHREK